MDDKKQTIIAIVQSEHSEHSANKKSSNMVIQTIQAIGTKRNFKNSKAPITQNVNRLLQFSCQGKNKLEL